MQPLPQGLQRFLEGCRNCRNIALKFISEMKRVRITNDSLNSYGFRVLTSGADIVQYQRNPVLLYMHERGKVIGVMKDLKVENGEITGEPFFDEATELSRQCKKQYEVGSLRMVSVGIDPLETSDAMELLLEGQTRPTVTKWKLVEVSLVDIGANDDAIVMKGDGTIIELEKDGSCMLPLLNNKTNYQETMNLESIALKLGLAKEADEKAVLDKIAELQQEASDAVTLRTENDSLKLAGIVTLVDGAIAEKKIGADKKDQFVNLGKKIGLEELKKTFGAMSAHVKVSELLSHQGGSPAGGEYKKLSDVPADKLIELREKEPETYKRLYKAEYGFECEI